jgi:hypothetical protein
MRQAPSVSLLSPVRLWLFGLSACLRACVPSCLVCCIYVLYSVSLYHHHIALYCILVCTYVGILATCILAAIGCLPLTSTRLASPRLASPNRTSSLGSTPAITRCCAHLYVIATGIHPSSIRPAPIPALGQGHPTLTPVSCLRGLCTARPSA